MKESTKVRLAAARTKLVGLLGASVSWEGATSLVESQLALIDAVAETDASLDFVEDKLDKLKEELT